MWTSRSSLSAKMDDFNRVKNIIAFLKEEKRDDSTNRYRRVAITDAHD